MPLTTRIATLVYDSGRHYRAGLEESTDKIRLYWEEDEDDGEGRYWQCFATFSLHDEEGNRRSTDEIVTKTDRIVVAHRLEPSDTLVTAHTA